jgi:hypothetical protein
MLSIERATLPFPRAPSRHSPGVVGRCVATYRCKRNELSMEHAKLTGGWSRSRLATCSLHGWLVQAMRQAAYHRWELHRRASDSFAGGRFCVVTCICQPSLNLGGTCGRELYSALSVPPMLRSREKYHTNVFLFRYRSAAILASASPGS